MRRAAWLAALLAVAAVAWQRALPRLVAKGVAAAWKVASPEPARFTVRSARWGRVVLEDLEVGEPGAALARAGSVTATFDWESLRRSEIRTLAVDGAWTTARQAPTGWMFPVQALLRPSEPEEDKGADWDRLPVEAIQVTSAEVSLLNAEGVTAGRVVADATVRRAPQGATRLSGIVQGNWLDDTASASFVAALSTLTAAAGAGKVSLAGQFNGGAVSGGGDVQWGRDASDCPAIAFTNGVAKVAHGLLRRWKPKATWWGGSDITLRALNGAFGQRGDAEGTGAPAGWSGSLSGRLETGRQSLGQATAQGASLEVETVQGAITVDVADSALADLRIELDVPRWRAAVGGESFDGTISGTLVHGAPVPDSGPGEAMSATLNGTLQPRSGLFSEFRFDPGGPLALAARAALSNGQIHASFGTPPGSQAFAWSRNGITATGTMAFDANGLFAVHGSAEGEGAQRSSGGRMQCRVGEMRVSGWGGSESNVVWIPEATGRCELELDDAYAPRGASMEFRARANVDAPPYLVQVPLDCESVVRWTPGQKPEVSFGCVSGAVDFWGVHGIVCRVTGIGVSNGAPVSISGEAVAAGSAAKVEVVANRLVDSGNWDLVGRVPPFSLTAQDDLQSLVQKYVPIEGALLTGDIGGSLTLRGRQGGTPSVSLRVSASNVMAKASGWQVADIVGDTELVLRRDQLRTTGEQTLRFGAAQIADMRFEGGRIRWQLEPDRVHVSSAELNWLGGQLQAYALTFDLNRHDTEFVLYVDGIDVGQLLHLVKPLAGSGEGRLYGRMPVRYEGGRWRLSTAYLYSMPGQEGLIRISDTRPLEGLLMQAGVSKEIRKALAEALRDFRFTTFALELHPPDADRNLFLAVRLLGVSRDPEKPTPVNATMNLRGPLETLLNMGVILGQLQN